MRSADCDKNGISLFFIENSYRDRDEIIAKISEISTANDMKFTITQCLSKICTITGLDLWLEITIVFQKKIETRSYPTKNI